MYLVDQWFYMGAVFDTFVSGYKLATLQSFSNTKEAAQRYFLIENISFPTFCWTYNVVKHPKLPLCLIFHKCYPAGELLAISQIAFRIAAPKNEAHSISVTK